MAKILVADDNSNIQKMVGQVLRDQGIDVVAVGNGEAAVRKISDLRPDLVLADVFMPVRNGYEVCEYVKADTKLAHIPVILLVGAFDPLDEQEAQRVGADGVLKKPFVPPDPLISMVKSALTRAGVPTVPEPAPVAAGAPPTPAPAHPISRERREGRPAPPELGPIPLAGGSSDSFQEQAPKHREPFSIAEGAQPLAFESLLRTPASKTSSDEPESDSSFVVARHPELDESRAWNSHRDAEEPEVVEEEETTEHFWRPTGAEELAAGDEAPSEDKTDWQATIFASLTEKKSEMAVPSEGSVPAQMTDAMAPAAGAEPDPESTAKAVPPSGRMSAPKTEFETRARGPEPVRSGKAPAGAEAAPSQVEEKRPAPPVSAGERLWAPVTEKAPQAESTAPSWFTNQASPWDAADQQASQLAATWDIPVETASSIQAAVTAVEHEAPQAAAPTIEKQRAKKLSGPEAAEAAPRTREPARAKPVTAEREPAALPQPDLDAVVAKVLEKIGPDMLQRMTREILKPVIEAIVRGELDAKK